MAKPLKFHQTLNQAPRSVKHGQHRRASPTPHRHSFIGTDFGSRGSDKSFTVHYTPRAVSSWISWGNIAEPPAIPHAGIRTGEIIGHRLWWVFEHRDGPWLCSLAHQRLWMPGETVHGDTTKVVGDPFFSFIFGGTYAFANADLMAGEVASLKGATAQYEMMKDEAGSSILQLLCWPYFKTVTFVSGTIKMWGDVVEHETGYRAEFAKLNSLDEIFGPGNLDALRTRYGVGAHTE